VLLLPLQLRQRGLRETDPSRSEHRRIREDWVNIPAGRGETDPSSGSKPPGFQ
jgi:hypothetical protein